MRPIGFGWGQGIPDIFIGNQKKFLVPDNEFGGPVSNLDVPFKTVLQYVSRSGMTGEGLIFCEEDLHVKRIPIYNSSHPAFDRVVGELPFAVVNREQKEVEIVWSDYSSTLVQFGEGKGEISYFLPEENRIRDNAKLIVQDKLGRVKIVSCTVVSSHAGTVRVYVQPTDSDEKPRVLAIKLYDGVWERWDKNQMEPTYLLREDNEVLRFFMEQKPQPKLIFGHSFSYSQAGPHPYECDSYVEKVGNYYLMRTTTWELKVAFVGFEDLSENTTWYYLVPLDDGEGVGFYVNDLQYCEGVANLLTEAEADC
jgi:hypothetical protein